MTTALLITALSSVLCVVGQALAKVGLGRLDQATGRSWIVALFCSPWIWAGGGLLVVGTLLWFQALARLELSIALPVSCLLTLVLSVVAGRICFGEALPSMRVAGLLLALLAAAMISRR